MYIKLILLEYIGNIYTHLEYIGIILYIYIFTHIFWGNKFSNYVRYN